MVGGANRILRIPSNDSRLTDPMGPWGPSWKMGGLPSGRRRSWSSALQMVPLWAWNSMALSTKATRLAIEYWIARTCLSSQGFVLSGYLEIWWFGTSFQDFHKHCIKWQFWVYHFFLGQTDMKLMSTYVNLLLSTVSTLSCDGLRRSRSRDLMPSPSLLMARTKWLCSSKIFSRIAIQK